MEWLQPILDFIVGTLASWGYTGLFVIMALESSLVPIPSEIVMIPAGYLVSRGEMNLWLVILSSTSGSLLGAVFNYYLAYFLGREFFQRYGKYIGVNTEHMEKVETYFHRHGAISTFIGRLTPVIRQLISMPAGFARMSIVTLSVCTFVGAGIWNAILVAIGYFTGQNIHLQEQLLGQITIYTVGALLVIVGGYLVYLKFSKQVEHTIFVKGDMSKLISNMNKTIIVSDHKNIRSRDKIVTETGVSRVYWNILQKYAYKEELLASLVHALCKEECTAEELVVLQNQYKGEVKSNAPSFIYVLKRSTEKE